MCFPNRQGRPTKSFTNSACPFIKNLCCNPCSRPTQQYPNLVFSKISFCWYSSIFCIKNHATSTTVHVVRNSVTSLMFRRPFHAFELKIILPRCSLIPHCNLHYAFAQSSSSILLHWNQSSALVFLRYTWMPKHSHHGNKRKLWKNLVFPHSPASIYRPSLSNISQSPFKHVERRKHFHLPHKYGGAPHIYIT